MFKSLLNKLLGNTPVEADSSKLVRITLASFYKINWEYYYDLNSSTNIYTTKDLEEVLREFIKDSNESGYLPLTPAPLRASLRLNKKDTGYKTYVHNGVIALERDTKLILSIGAETMKLYLEGKPSIVDPLSNLRITPVFDSNVKARYQVPNKLVSLDYTALLFK